jgi:hypothetical protein
MLKSEIPVHRYHFFSGLAAEVRPPPLFDGSRTRIKLNFGDAATLDLSHNTYMLVVEKLLIASRNVGSAAYALYISNTGYSSTRATGADEGKCPVVLCTERGIDLGPVTRSYMGTVISNPNFLNDYIDMQIMGGLDNHPMGVQDVAGFSGTFVVYRYQPN